MQQGSATVRSENQDSPPPFMLSTGQFAIPEKGRGRDFSRTGTGMCKQMNTSQTKEHRHEDRQLQKRWDERFQWVDSTLPSHERLDLPLDLVHLVQITPFPSFCELFLQPCHLRSIVCHVCHVSLGIDNHREHQQPGGKQGKTYLGAAKAFEAIPPDTYRCSNNGLPPFQPHSNMPPLHERLQPV